VRATLAYAPRPGPLGSARPWIAAVYLLPLAFAAFTFANPIVLAAAGLGTLAAGAASGAAGSLAQPLRWSVALGLMVIVVNALVAQRGATVLLRGWDLPVVGQIDVTAEALAEGGVLALRIIVAILVFAVWSACVDPDRILRALRPIASRSALTATLVARMVPLAAADATRFSEAARLRGPAAEPIGRATLARRMVAGSLDRSVDIAATLELRGYGLGHRSRMPRHRREPGEVALLLSGAASLALLIAAALAGVAGFDAYPRIQVDVDPATLLLALLVAVLPLVPFALERPRRLLRRSRRPVVIA
jgi:energy-coupling factor transport system permease protein